jgi:hypothetical protein
MLTVNRMVAVELSNLSEPWAKDAWERKRGLAASLPGIATA